MALATQCPHCHTIFKVAHDQLKLRAGLVRCGACKQIFNGIEHLVPPDRLNPPPPQPARAAPAAPSAPQPSPAPITPPVAPPPPASPATALHPKGKEPFPAARPTEQNKAPTATSDTPLELAQVDDPETRTWIWSPASKQDKTTEEPLDDLGEDPLTRMTLVDFSAFEEEEDLPPAKEEPAAVKDELTPQPAPPARQPGTVDDNPSDEHSWPNTTDEPVKPKTTAVKPSAIGPEVRIPTPPTPPKPEPMPDLPAKEGPATDLDTDIGVDTNTGTNVDVDTDSETETSLTDDTELLAEEEDLNEAEEPGFVVRERRRQRIRSIMRIFMAVASVILLAAALAQAAYAFRDQIAARFPQYKAALADYCQLIGCQVKLPAQIDMVSIESSELQAQAANKNIFTLTLLLHNRSEVNQAWPFIELTLNDNNEQPLVRRILSPREYLANEKDVARGFTAQSEQPVSVSFELLQLQASGYRVYLFYP